MLSVKAHIGMMRGSLAYTYRGLKCIRYPIDMPLYLLLLQELRPATVIEIGSREGGGAAWLGDMLNVLGISAKVISVDIDKPNPKYQPFNVFFLKADENDLAQIGITLAVQPHPWLVINDASHQYAPIMNCLSFLNRFMVKGDYLVVEDGYISLAGMDGNTRHGGPARAISEFLTHAKDWRIDARYCDFYGHNATANTNGYLVKC